MASSASALPWLWVIEALASVKEVDASVLKEFVKKVPEISGDLGENAREMVNFRVLETLASQQVGRNGSSSLASVSEKIFNPSDHCEDVVGHMLRERKNDVEMFKLQVQNFVTQKSAVLPKCSLQKLKDAILEEKHAPFASLKAKSGLSTISRSKDRGDIIEGAWPCDGKVVVKSGNLTSSNMENLNGFSRENCQNKNLTPLKRDLCHLESEDQALSSHNDSPSVDRGGDTDLSITKKLKHVLSRTGRDEPPETLVDELDLDLPVNEAKDGENCGADVATSNAAPPNQTPENTCDETNNVEKSLPTPSNNFPHETRHPSDHNLGRECSSDSDGYQEERLHIAMRKCDFLSSQCTFTRDSLATDDCTELSICMKCEKAGDLLVCSANACPIVVHERCLGIAPSFDNNGNFICPFCSYSRSIAEYLKIKKKASLVRKDLATFSGLENGNRNGHTHQKHVNEISNCKNKEKVNDNPQEEPSTSRVNGNSPLTVDGALVDDETIFSTKEGNREGGKIGPECQTNMPLERREIEVHASSSCREREFVPLTEKHAPEQDSRLPNADVVERSDEQDGQPDSVYVMRPRKQEKQYTSPVTNQLRRKKVPWTSEEEEVLKEGVKKLTGDHDKNIQWKKILEFGRSVFLKGRTAADLKDKWRNICKRRH